jgi:hypothetical protein
MVCCESFRLRLRGFVLMSQKMRTGYMLDLRSDREEGLSLEGSPIVVKVMGASSFPAPSPDVETSFEVAGFPGYGLRIPAGAWPAGDSRPLKLSILDVSASPELAAALQSIDGAKFVGSGVYYEPHGIRFAKPVEIAIPYDPSIDVGNLELNINRYDPANGFEKIQMSSQRMSPVDVGLKLIYGETSSFSLYAPLATQAKPPPPDAPPATTTAGIVVTSTPQPSGDELPVVLIVGATLGGVAFLLLVAAIYCKCCRGDSAGSKPTAAGAPVPAASERAAAQPKGIKTQEARAERQAAIMDPEPAARDRSLPAPAEVPKPAEPTPAMNFSTRYAPEVPPPEEEAPILRAESPRRAERSSPPMTPSAPIESAEISLQVFACLFTPKSVCRQ